MATGKPSLGKALFNIIFGGLTTWILVLFALHLTGWLVVAAWVLVGVRVLDMLALAAGFGMALDRLDYTTRATK